MIKAATILAGGMPSAVRQWAGPDSSAQAAVAAEDFLSGCYAVDPAAVLSKKARCAHTPTSPPWDDALPALDGEKRPGAQSSH